MAKFDYGKMQGTASRLMERFAQGVVTLERPGEEIPPPNEWTDPTYTDPVTIPLNAAVKGVSEKYINGTTIVATDLEVTAAVFGDEMGVGDVLKVDGKPVQVIKTMKIPAAGVTVAWKFIVRS